MTYSQVLLAFLVPPVLIFALGASRLLVCRFHTLTQAVDKKPCLGILVLLVLALLYTTPWDNYLVAHEVWGYDLQQVWGIRLGWVPLEEYLFFVLQTLLTGLWVILLAKRFCLLEAEIVQRPRFRFYFSALVGVFWALSLGLLVTGWKTLTYLGLIFVWSLIPLFVQVVFGADILLANGRLIFLSLAPTTIYLWFVDALAIRSGVWFIDPAQSTGFAVNGLPLEEMVFFLVTNLIIVLGMVLLLSPDSLVRLKAGKRFLCPVI
jgi:lycopene cyclase domain-containing protein